MHNNYCTLLLYQEVTMEIIRTCYQKAIKSLLEGMTLDKDFPGRVAGILFM